MRGAFLRIYLQTQVLAQTLHDENGQDLVEYALVIAVVCLGLISGMGTLANGINTAMSTLSGNINNAMA